MFVDGRVQRGGVRALSLKAYDPGRDLSRGKRTFPRRLDRAGAGAAPAGGAFMALYSSMRQASLSGDETAVGAFDAEGTSLDLMLLLQRGEPLKEGDRGNLLRAENYLVAPGLQRHPQTERIGLSFRRLIHLGARSARGGLVRRP